MKTKYMKYITLAGQMDDIISFHFICSFLSFVINIHYSCKCPQPPNAC